MQGLSCLDVQGEKVLDLVDIFLIDSRESEGTIDEARELMRGAWEDRDACDAILSRHARHWDLPRLALVDRNILRLATHELRRGGAHFKIVISEAIKLANEFSTAESPRFINGILDAVAKELFSGDERR